MGERAGWHLRTSLSDLRVSACDLRTDLGRLRSKSCERVLASCRAAARSLGRTVSKEPEPQPAGQFGQARLRQSRRRPGRARPAQCYARALNDVTPSPYGDDLALRTGDLVGVINRDPSGTWLAECDGRVGRVKFINLELVESESGEVEPGPSDSVAELLSRAGLAHLGPRLQLNGWDSLERLEGVSRVDLAWLGVEQRAEQDRLLQSVRPAPRPSPPPAALSTRAPLPLSCRPQQQTDRDSLLF